MKYLGTLLLGFLSGACAHSGSLPDPPSTKAQLAEVLQRQTVALVGSNSVPYCSGVWLSEQHILTAYHCVDDEGPAIAYATYSDVFPTLSLHQRKVLSTHTAGVQALDAEHDLALLLAPNAPPHALAKPTLKQVRPGDDIFTMGHPIGLWWSFSSGQVAAVREVEGQVFVQSTAPISMGCSGGGLFDDQGSLVGIASKQLPPSVAQNVNISVSGQDIDAFIRKSIPQ